MPLMLVLPACADDSSWSNLAQLKPGDRIGVVQSNQKRMEGRFQGFNNEGISLRTDQDVTIGKGDVVRVYKRPRVGRGLKAVIGGALGVAAAGVVAGTLGQYLRNEG